MQHSGEKKLSLKRRLITVISLICILQFLFLLSGYLFVLNNLTERAQQRAVSAFNSTLSYIDDLASYANNLEDIMTKSVKFDLITRSRYETELADTAASLRIICNMLQSAAADSRIDDAIVYFPDDRIYISGVQDYRLYEESLLSKGNALFSMYSGSGGKFVEYTEEDGTVNIYYLMKFSKTYGNYRGVFMFLQISQDYFNSLEYFDENSSVMIFQDDKLLFASRAGFSDNRTIDSWMETGKESGIVKISGRRYYVQRRAGNNNQTVGVYAVPASVHFSEIYKFLLISVASLAVNLAVWIYFSRNLIFKTVYGPVMDLVGNLEKVKNNDYSIVSKRFAEQEWDEVTQVFNMMVTKINDNVKETYQKDLLMKNMELKFLQSQINPHFLYNTLDSIAYKANNGEIVDVNKITGYLSKMYRLVFNKGSDFLSVSNIMLCCEMYLKICEFKYQNFSFRISYDPEIGDIEALNLIIQTIVENSVVHGYDASKTPFIVSVSAKKNGGDLVFTVADNGKGFSADRLEAFKEILADPDSPSESGLVNAQKRVKLYYGDRYGLTVESRSGYYTKVTVLMSLDRPATELSEEEEEE